MYFIPKDLELLDPTNNAYGTGQLIVADREGKYAIEAQKKSVVPYV